MATVNWTNSAIAALNDIYSYLHREAPYYADHVVEQIILSVDRLEIHPLSGRSVPEAGQKDIREVICQNYRIIYWVAGENQLNILGVLHASRDLTEIRNQPWDRH
jgi:toxin ParE1/3/4